MGLFNNSFKNEVDLGVREEYLNDAVETKVGFIRLGRSLRINADRIVKYDYTGKSVKLWYLDYNNVGKEVLKEVLIKADIEELDALLDCRVNYNISKESDVEVVNSVEVKDSEFDL